MSNEELVKVIKEGQTENIPLLWENVNRFIMKQANRYLSQFPEDKQDLFNDMVNQSYFGLLAAISGYDENKGMFTTYLGYYIHNEFEKVAKGGHSKRAHLEPLLNSISYETEIEGEGITLLDTLIDYTAADELDEVNYYGFWKDVHELLAEGIIHTSNPDIKPALSCMLEKGCSYTEATKLLGCERDFHKYRKALNEIKRFLEKNRNRLQRIGLDDYIGTTGGGLSAYLNSNFTSLVERTAIKREEIAERGSSARLKLRYGRF